MTAAINAANRAAEKKAAQIQNVLVDIADAEDASIVTVNTPLLNAMGNDFEGAIIAAVELQTFGPCMVGGGAAPLFILTFGH
jgi:hypothetical protein